MTDVENSTGLWAAHPECMHAVMSRHHDIVHRAISAHGGRRPADQGEGDSVFAGFDSAADAVAAAAELQAELSTENWPDGIELGVRVGIHGGQVFVRNGNLAGTTVNRCARIRGLGAGGQILLSAAVRDQVMDQLPPGTTTLDLGQQRLKGLGSPERVYQLVAPGLPRDFPPLPHPFTAPNNLPTETTSLIGREADIAALLSLIKVERLVSVVGFGGTGKTRLALRAAAELTTSSDGVWFVDLSTAADPEQIYRAAATAAGLGDRAGGPLAALVEEMAAKDLVLVLDNLEQLLPGAAPLVERLLLRTTISRLIVTSREPIGIPGECVYPLQPLPAPPPRRAGSYRTSSQVEALGRNPAVALFVSRAIAATPEFTLTPDNASPVAEICADVDGLPLALELAAARTAALSVHALLPRLSQALNGSTLRSRHRPARQQTLQATIAWSYDALEPGARRLLDLLSVFPGSFSLEAAEQVCAPAPDGDPTEVLDALTSLVDRSLVNRQRSVGPQMADRYVLLVSIREFAASKLRAAGGVADAQARHCTYFLDLAVRAEDKLDGGSDQAAWFTLLERERTNLYRALDALAEAGDTVGLARLANSLWRFWLVHGPHVDGRRWLGVVLEDAELPVRLRSRIQCRAGVFAQEAGDFEQAAALYGASAETLRRWPVSIELADVICNQGLLAQDRGNSDEAAALLEEALVLREQLGDALGKARVLDNLGTLAKRRGDLPAAHELLERSSAAFDVLHDLAGMAISLYNLGEVELDMGSLDEAVVTFERGLLATSVIGDRWTTGSCLDGLSRVAERSGRLVEAVTLFASAVSAFEPADDPAAADLDDTDRAFVTDLQTRLTAEIFDESWTRGAQFSLEDSIEHGLAFVSSIRAIPLDQSISS